MSIYDVAAYGAMIADDRRLDAYRDALRRRVQPGSTLVDVGTGTGIFALLACRLGASRVYAIEAGDVIQVARDIARANGLEDRISFFHDPSRRVTLPERVDVMVSDLRGSLPLFSDHLPSIIDARRRFLEPGGWLIPRRDELWAAPVQDEEFWDKLVSPWETNEAELDMRAARAMVTHCLHARRFDAGALLASGQRWATLEYGTIDRPDATGAVDFALEREGTVHGFVLWFDSMLDEGVTLSNAPDKPELIYGSVFMPLSEPIRALTGEQLVLQISAKPIGTDYVWRWETTLNGRDGAQKARMEQSTFRGAPLTKTTLTRAAASAMPTLSRDGDIARDGLAMLDGGTRLSDVAQRLYERYPDALEDPNAALDRIAALALRYAK